jgi:hypothetical protein
MKAGNPLILQGENQSDFQIGNTLPFIKGKKLMKMPCL